MRLPAIALVAMSLFPAEIARAEMRGHGGPVRALAVLPGGGAAVSGSFDQSVIRWDLERGEAAAVLRFHDGAVNALLALPDGRFASAGEDGRIAFWTSSQDRPVQVVQAHKGPLAALALSPDGGWIASASWDGTARVTELASGQGRLLEGHQGQVNGVAFLSDGRVVTGGYDATLRIWPAQGAPTVATLPSPLNAVASGAGDRILAGSADGVLRSFGADGRPGAELDLQSGPILSMAVSPDQASVAVAVIGGSVAMLDGAGTTVRMRLVGPGLPVWSVAFTPDGRELLTGGSDRLVRRWDARTGEHIGPVVLTRTPDLLAVAGNERGAEVFKACAACHTLGPGHGNRAGPSLHGIFGRRIASLEGYNYSEALKQLDIVWNAETISRLFEIGPNKYLPGTKMPEQTVSAEDRAALVRFLESATRPNR